MTRMCTYFQRDGHAIIIVALLIIIWIERFLTGERGGPYAWPARSPDLNSQKVRVYHLPKKSDNINELLQQPYLPLNI